MDDLLRLITKHNLFCNKDEKEIVMKTYEQLKALYDEIDILIAHHVTGSAPEFIKWHKKVERFLKMNYHEEDEYADFMHTSFRLHAWSSGTPASAWIKACENGLRKTKAVFEVYLEEMQKEDDVVALTNDEKQIKCSNNKVFVVHGHDGKLKYSIARTLEKQGIEPIILSEQVNQGATIIEKFERYSDVNAAICLFTEDDLGRTKTDEDLRARARQNVVFEAGYFIGKLGRKNVILLANREIDMPSDLSGVVYTDNVMWEIQVLKELREIGFVIDLNKTI